MQTLKSEETLNRRIARRTEKNKIPYRVSEEDQLKFMENWFKEIFWLLNRKGNYLVINRSNHSFFYGNESLASGKVIPIVGIMPFDTDIFDVYAVDEESKKAFETLYYLIS